MADVWCGLRLNEGHEAEGQSSSGVAGYGDKVKARYFPEAAG